MTSAATALATVAAVVSVGAAGLVEQTGAEEEKPRIKIDFQKGDTVRVKEGAFENFDGIVEEINSQKGLVGITITIFGRATRVELEYWQVEKV